MRYGIRARVLALTVAGGLTGALISTEAMAAAHFSFKFTGTMSCMSPIPIANAPISGGGSGIINDDNSVSADVTQSLLVFSTSLHFDSKISPGVTAVPGGTAQVRVAGRQSLRFIWNLPNNTLLVTIGVHGNSCTASFQANLLPGKTQYTFFDGGTYHYCGPPGDDDVLLRNAVDRRD